MSYLGTPPNEDIVSNVKEYVATAGQTVFEVIYDNYAEVSLNGTQLASSDYTMNNGISITLAVGATAGDIVQCTGYESFKYNNTVDTSTAQIVSGVKTFTSSPVIPDAVNADEALNKGQLLTEIKTVDGAGSGLDADLLDGIQSTAYLNSIGTSIGNYLTNGYIQAGAGRGSVTMNVNDGYGNANLAFNHNSGVPDFTGNAGRIIVNTDVSTGAALTFQVKSGVTAGTAVALTNVMQIYETYVNILGAKIWTQGNDGAGSGLDADLLDGKNSSVTAVADTIPIRDVDTAITGKNQCTAWVNFDGSTPTILSSYNISSIVKNGTGDFTLNFTTPMIDANYSVSFGQRENAGQNGFVTEQHDTVVRTTTQLRIYSIVGTTTTDFPITSVQFFGGK